MLHPLPWRNGTKRPPFSRGDSLMPPTKACVLVVDDDRDNREMLSEFLSFSGFDVSSASDGAEALSRAVALRPSVVLMDIALPGIMDGLETTRRIRLEPALKHAVVIAVTGLASPDTYQRAIYALSLIHISEPTRLLSISYAVFC